MKKVMFFHTTPATLHPMQEAFKRKFPHAKLLTLFDDSILPEVLENANAPTEFIVRKLMTYGALAQESGADVFENMCTTLGIAMRHAQKALTIPMLTIDGPMLRQAVRAGKRIGMLITFPPTAGPSRDAAMAFAEEAGKEVLVDVIVVEGARVALNNGDKTRHDRLIAEKAKEVAGCYDVLVFAQVTMLEAAECGDLGVPVMTSVESGLEQLNEYGIGGDGQNEDYGC